MSGYDRALTVFSPDGHLFQVEYAREAVKKGTATVGIRGTNFVILAIENRSTSVLQEDKSVRKICQIDEHIHASFAGLQADARILVDVARLECQNHRLTFDEPPSAAMVTDSIARTQQKHTQRGGMRPFGVSALFASCDADRSMHLYLTEPGGVTSEWYACAIGRGEAAIRKFLENHYTQEMTQDAAIDLAIGALLEVLEPKQKLFDVFVFPDIADAAYFLTTDQLDDRIQIVDATRNNKAKEEIKMAVDTA